MYICVYIYVCIYNNIFDILILYIYMYRLCPLSLRSFARKVGPATALTLPEMCMTVINTLSLPPSLHAPPSLQLHERKKQPKCIFNLYVRACR